MRLYQHLGQGANQAFEDVYHLVRALVQHHPSPTLPPTTAQLASAFEEYERVRLPRSAELVRKARARGEERTMHVSLEDADAVEKREMAWKETMREENIWKEMDAYARGPYEGESEI